MAGFQTYHALGTALFMGRQRKGERGEQNTKESYKICRELTHKEMAVSSLVLNRSSFKTRETLADPFVTPSVLSGYILILIIFTPCE